MSGNKEEGTRSLPFLYKKSALKGAVKIRQTTAGINGNRMLPE